jgi:putative DNA primase/helicase
MWHHGIPAIGVPGAASWNEERDAPLLDGIPTIYVVIEPDKGGETMREWVSRSTIRDRVKLIYLPVKDPSALHLQDPGEFTQRWQAACLDAIPWSEDEAEDNDEAMGEEALLTQLAKLTPFQYAKRREGAAEQLGVPLKALDAEVKHRRRGLTDEGGGKAVQLCEPEPWSDPIDGETMADAIAEIIRRAVVLAPEAADAVTLWVILAHVHDAARFSPVLGIVSPSPECGKTTLLSTVGLMVPKPLWANNITAAAVFRSVEQWQPCLLIDEADSFLSENEELRGVLNSGHNRDAAFVIRTVGDDHEPRQFGTWAPKAIALIGKLPPTLISRAILIELRRLGVNETITPLDDLRDHALTLGRHCARWARDHIDEIRKAKPQMPAVLRGRRADNWKTMIAIANVIGGEWPERARGAAMALSGGRREESAGIELLADIKAVFDTRQIDRLTSKDLVEALGAMEDRPWPEWSRGKPLTARQLARLLEPFKIKPKVIRQAHGTPRGYELGAFADVFARYVIPDPPSPTATPQQPQEAAISEPITSATAENDVAETNGPETAEDGQCCGVADESPPGETHANEDHAQKGPGWEARI